MTAFPKRSALSSRCIFAIYTSFLCLICLSNSAFCSDKQIKVGVIAGFTGDYAAYGLAFRNGIELAKVGSNIRFIYEDDQFIPSKTLSAFQKLTQLEKVDIILVGDSTSGQAVAPLAKKLKLPLLVWATSQHIFKGNEYVLRLWSEPNRDFYSIKNLIQQKKWHKLAVFSASHFYSEQWGSHISKTFQETSWHRFTNTPESFQPQLLKVKKLGVDALGVCLDPGANGLLIRQARELKMTMPIFGCNFLEASADVLTASSNIEGVLFTSPKISKTFFEEYRNRFGTTNHLLSAALFHDAARLIDQAVNKLPDDDFMRAILHSSLIEPALSGLKVVSTGGESHLEFDFTAYVYSGLQFTELYGFGG